MADKCESALLSQFEGDDKETKALMDEINKITDRRAEWDPSKTREQHFDQVLDEFIEDQLKSAERTEIALAGSLRARDSLMASFNGFINNLGVKPVAAVARAVEAFGNDVVGFTARTKAIFADEVDKAGLSRYLSTLRKDDVEQAKVLMEVGELNRKKGQPGKSGSKNAQKLAKIYQDIINPLRERQLKAGVRVDDLEGRMLRQVWDRDSLLQFGNSSDFATAMLPRVNRLRTFKRPASNKEVESFLKRFYDDVVSGDERDITLDARSIVRERETFAGRQLHNRTIHLNGAEDSLFALQRFGDGDVAAAMFGAVGTAANKTRIVEVFGVNPRNTVEHLMNMAKKGLTPEEKAEIVAPSFGKSFKGENVDAMMSVIDGSFERNSDPSLALAMHTIGNTVRFTLLQNVLTSSFPDLATVSRANARIGGKVLDDVSVRWRRITQGLSPKLERMMAGAVETANAYNVGALAQRVGGTGVLPGLANTSTFLSNATMKWTGLNMWTRHGKATSFVLGSSVLSRLRGTAFSELEDSVKGMLTRGNVTEADWGELAKIKNASFKEGRHELLDLDAIAEVNRPLSEKLHATLFNFTNDAVPTPGVRERAIMTQGTQAGTPSGMLVRFMSSLLGYPISYMTRQMGREAEAGGGFGMSGQAKLIAASIFAGYVSLVAKDVSKGRVRDYTSSDVDKQAAMLLEALAVGGGGGLAGSVLINTLTFGDTASSLISGAPASVIDDVVNSMVASGKYIIGGEGEKASAEAIKTIRKVTPFVNMPQTKLIIDSTIYNPLMDMVAPGSLRREERRWHKRTGGSFLLEN